MEAKRVKEGGTILREFPILSLLTDFGVRRKRGGVARWENKKGGSKVVAPLEDHFLSCVKAIGAFWLND